MEKHPEAPKSLQRTRLSPKMALVVREAISSSPVRGLLTVIAALTMVTGMYKLCLSFV